MKNVNKILHTLSIAASDTREDTINSIIVTTLFENKKSLDQKELNDSINIIYEIQLYENELVNALHALKENDTIKATAERYELTKKEEARLVGLESDIQKKEAIRFQNFQNFLSEVDGTCGEGEIKLLWETFREFLYACFFCMV